MVASLAALAAQGALAETADEIARAAFNLEVELEAFANGIRPYLLRAGGRGIDAMYAQYGIDGVTIDSDFIRTILQSQESRFAQDMADTSIRGIRDEIARGIAAGEGHYQLRDRVLGFYERQNHWRANLAAQYETGTAFEAVREALALRQGMTHKRWETMRDDKVETRCLANESAGWVSADAVFPGGVTRPLQHPLCRCWLSWSVEPNSAE